MLDVVLVGDRRLDQPVGYHEEVESPLPTHYPAPSQDHIPLRISEETQSIKV